MCLVALRLIVWCCDLDLVVACYYCLFCVCVLPLIDCVGWFSVGMLDLVVWVYFVCFGCGDVGGLVFWLWRFACLGSWFVLGCVGWVFWLVVFSWWFVIAVLVGLVFVMIASDLLGVAFVWGLVCFCVLRLGFATVLIWLIVLLLGAVLLPFM